MFADEKWSKIPFLAVHSCHPAQEKKKDTNLLLKKKKEPD